jgi:stage II sporulation protein D
MKKIGYFILMLVFLMFLIPIIILGGIGPGIKIPIIINKLPFLGQDNKNNENDLKKGISIKVAIKGKLVTMPLEEYVVGVVAAEMPVNFDTEALKSQAIAARTFAVAKMKIYGGTGCVRNPGADVCSETHCQVWITKEDRFKSWKPEEAIADWNKIVNAVATTEGMVISYKGKLATGVKYFSTSDGKTENSLYAFGYAEPYLVSVDSPNEEEAPSFKSQVVMSKADFIARIKKVYPGIKVPSDKLASQVKVLDYTEGGRVKTIKIGEKTFSGIDIRWAMSLKSADFNIGIDKKNVTFNVKGYGHGVGMSQWGANEMGKRGMTYDSILKHYFKGIEISKIDSIFKNNKTS